MSATLFSDFLRELSVSHTIGYSNMAYRAMPFQSCFGLKKLLEEYNINSEGVVLADKAEINKLPIPFLAKMSQGFVIVTAVTPQSVSYLSAGVTETAPVTDFINSWTGMALIANPDSDAIEPNYGKHKLAERLMQVKKAVLAAATVFLILYSGVANGVFKHPSLIFALLFNCAGLFFTYLLVQKSLHIKSATSDKMCGMIEQHGCDHVLSTKAASFFGLFGWSEVGFAYFSISLTVLLAFPQAWGSLALINVCCLPFSFWSVWYQKTQAKAWCTLCLCVQATLWCLFFCYLSGGWLRLAFPLNLNLFPLGAAYLATLLGINRLMPLIEQTETHENENDITA